MLNNNASLFQNRKKNSKFALEKNFKKHNGFGDILDKMWKKKQKKPNKHLNKYNKLRNIFSTHNSYKTCKWKLTGRHYEIRTGNK